MLIPIIVAAVCYSVLLLYHRLPHRPPPSSPSPSPMRLPTLPGRFIAPQDSYINKTSYLWFSGCCLFEECDKYPCDKDKICSKMASCQSDKCNIDYATAKASPRPTLPSKACRVLVNSLVMSFVAIIVFASTAEASL